MCSPCHVFSCQTHDACLVSRLLTLTTCVVLWTAANIGPTVCKWSVSGVLIKFMSFFNLTVWPIQCKPAGTTPLPECLSGRNWLLERKYMKKNTQKTVEFSRWMGTSGCVCSVDSQWLNYCSTRWTVAHF